MRSMNLPYLSSLGARRTKHGFERRATWLMVSLAVLLAVLAVAVSVHRTAWANEPVVTISVTDINYETATASFTVTGLPDSVTPTNWIASVNYKAPPDRYGHTLRAGPGRYSDTQDDFTAVLSGNTLTADNVHLTRLIPDSEHTLTVTIMQRVGSQSPKRAEDSTTFTAKSGCSPSPEPNHKDPDSISPTRASWFGTYEFRHVTETEFLLEVSLNPSFESKHAPLNSGACVYYKYDESFGTFQSGIITAYIHDNLSGGKRGAFIRHTGLTPATRYGFRLTMDEESIVGDITVYGTTLGPNTGIDEITFTDITQNRARATATIENASSDPKFGYWHYRESPIDSEPERWGIRSEKLTEGATFPIELDNLEAGTRYELEASVKDNFNPNMSMTKAFVTLPGKPGISPLEVGDGSLKVTWTAPTEGAATIAGYRVQWQEYDEYFDYNTSPPPTSSLDYDDVAADITNHTIENLTNGTKYVVIVIAKNESFDDFGGTASDYESGTPMTLPNAPNNLQVAPGIEQLTLSWDEPADTGSADITGYVVEYKKQSEPTIWSSHPTVTAVAGTTAYETTISNLDFSTEYDVRVRADNDVALQDDDGYNWTEGSETTLPDKPTSLAVESGNRQLTLSWEEPSDLGSVSISDYVVQYRKTSETSWTTSSATNQESLDSLTSITTYSNTFTALDYSTEYDVRVRADNDVTLQDEDNYNWAEDDGQTIPDSPVDLGVTPGDESLILTWKAPADSGSIIISGFIVQYKKTADSGWNSLTPLSAAALGTTIRNLDNDDLYLVRVRAVNTAELDDEDDYNWAREEGTPVPSPSIETVTVDANSVTQTEATVTVTLDRTNDVTQKAYIQYQSVPNGGWSTPPKPGDIDAISGDIVLDTLEGNTEYEVQAWLETDVNNKVKSLPFTTNPVVPEAPDITSVAHGDRELTVTWTAPSETGGADIEHFVVQWKPNTVSDWASLLVQEGSTIDETVLTYPITGLSNGTTYDIRVRADNGVVLEAGQVYNWDEHFGTPDVLPEKPTIQSVVEGHTQLVVTWDEPANTGSDIAGYVVQWKDNSVSGWASPLGSATLEENDFTNTITSLANGTEYAVRVRAVNGLVLPVEDDYNWSDDETGTPRPEPIVTGVTVADATITRTSATATVTIENETDDGQTVHLQYRKTTESGWTPVLPPKDVTATATSETFNISSLTGNTSYVVEAWLATTRNIKEPATFKTGPVEPDAPRNVEITGFGDGELTVAWDAPLGNGGSAITGYKVQWKEVDTLNWSSPSEAPDDASPYTIENLTNGTRYDVRVLAVNDVGDGPPSGDVEGTPSTRPQPPTITDITHGHQKLTVTWIAPTGTDTGGSDITGFIVQWKKGTDPYNTTNQATPPASPYEITNLLNGTEYTVRVFAVNESYPDDPSDESNEMTGTPSTVPHPPTDVTITGFGDESLTVSWTAPTNTDTGGSPITGFKIQWKLNSDADWNTNTYTEVDDDDNQSPYTIEGVLTNGTKYDVRVIAVNINGDSRESAAATGTPSKKPNAPTGVDITDYGDGWLEVTWNAVTGTGTGGSDIKNYIVQWKSGTDGYDTTNQATPPPTETTYKITNLENGTEYTVRLLAVNETYPNDPSDDPGNGTNEDTETPRTKPKPPTGVNISEYGDGFLEVAWTAPEDNGGSALVSFKVQWKESSVSSWDSPDEQTVTAVSGQTDYETTISSLTNGTRYTVRVLAVNGNRASDNTSDPSNTASGTPSTMPLAPKSVTITNEGDRTLTVTWEPPDNDGGSAITGYKVQWTSPANDKGASDRQHVITGLTNGTEYTVQVFAKNTNGYSTEYGEVTGIPSKKPDPPTDVEVSAHGNKWLEVTWTEPVDKGGLDTTYIVQWKWGANDFSETYQEPSAISPQEISNLQNGTLYTVRVLAENARGKSGTSNTDTGTPMTKPQPPTDVSIAGFGDESLTVSWTAPTGIEGTGGSPITGFKIQWKLNSEAVWNTSTYTEVDDADGQSPYTIEGVLTNGTMYDVRVLAVNGNENLDDNTSDPSEAATGTPSRKPHKPTGVDITDHGDGWLEVTWNAVTGTDTGGSDIKNYIVQWKSGTDGYDTTNQATPTTSPYKITNLNNGTPYTVRVLAVNEANPDTPGDPSEEVTETPRTIPGEVTDLGVISGDEELTVSWTAPVPEKNGGAGINRYIVQWKSGDQEYDTSRQETPSNTSQVIKPLTNGTPYSIRVRADNDEEPEAGQDYNWEETTGTPMTVPGAPTDLEVEEGDRQLKVTWVAPTNTGGLNIEIDHFVIQWQVKDGNWSSPREHTTTDETVLTDTITGLLNGTDYDIRVRADNDVAGQTFQWAYTTGKPRKIPSAPRSLRVTPGNGQLALSWAAPSDKGGLDINQYIVQWKSGIQEYDTSRQATPIVTSQVIGDLTNGTLYSVRVRADNSVEANVYNWAQGTGTPVATPNPPPPPQNNNPPPPPPPQRSPVNPTPPVTKSPEVASVSVTNETQTTADTTVKIDNAGTAQNTVNLRYSVDGEDSWTNHTKTETGSTAEFPLSSLTAGTTYEVEAWLGSDTDNKVTATFTTSMAPSISSISVGGITKTSATATVNMANPGDAQNTVNLRYSVDGEDSWTDHTKTETGSTMEFPLSSLTAGTTYEVEAWLGSATDNKVTATFMTIQAAAVTPPSISSVRVLNIAQASARVVVGLANANAEQRVYLKYKLSSAQWPTTSPQNTTHTNGSATFILNSLTAGTGYHVRVSLNSDMSDATTRSFTTTSPPPPQRSPDNPTPPVTKSPEVSSVTFINIMQTSAVTNVSIKNAGTAQKTVRLHYRADGTTDWSTPPKSSKTKSSGTTIALTGLTAGTTYEVQVWLNSGTSPPGTQIYEFTTLDEVFVAEPAIASLQCENIGQTSATAIVVIADAGTGMKEVFLKHSIQGEDEWTMLPFPTITYDDDTSIPLTGLTEGTTYEVVVALSEDFSGMFIEACTTLLGPSLSGVSISGITQTSAVATVNIADAGTAQKTVSLRHRRFGETEWDTARTKTTTDESAAFDLTGLSPQTMYEVEAALSSDFTDSATATFTTLSPDPRLSNVIMRDIKQTTATAAIEIADPGDTTTTHTVYLHYRTTPQGEWSETQTANSNTVTIEKEESNGEISTIVVGRARVSISGLTADTEYEVQVSLDSEFGDTVSATFTTLRYPSISDVDVTDITKTTATSKIDIADPDGSRQTVHLRYRTTTPQGDWSGALTTTSTTAEASINLTGLITDTEYEVEVSLTSDFTVAVSDTFRTLPPDPVVSKVSVNSIRQTTATAAIDIANTNGSTQTVSLRYRTTTPRGNWSGIKTATSTTDSASIDLSGLIPGTEYDVQASLDSSFPTTRTKSATFTTLRWPSIASFEVDNIGRNGATVSATIADSRGVAQTVYVRHRAAGYIAWRPTQQVDSVDDIASLRLRGLTSGTEYVAEASLDNSFPDGGTRSVTFTTKKRDDDDAVDSDIVISTARTANVPLLGVSPQMLRFVAIEGGDNPSPQTFSVWNRAPGAMRFNLSNHEEWLSQQPMSGVSNGPEDLVAITASVDSSELASGQYVDVINIDVTSSGKSPGQVIVLLDVLPPDYIRQFVSRDEGGVVVLPDGTVKLIVQPLSPPRDVDIEVMKLNLQAHGQPPGEQERVVVAIESNTYEPGGDTPEDVAYTPYVELWVQLPQEDAAACDESRARVYSVQSGSLESH